MKKLLSLIALLSVYSMLAQAPQKMSYQAIIRNSANGLVVSSNVGMKVSILKGSISGTPVYVETHTGTTNVNGLLSIEIGTGNVSSGSFSTINWGDDSYFIKSETDPDGGSNYTITGTSQLLSVPYALYAETSKNPGKTTIYLTGDITDLEASNRLAKELGPNTETIYIKDTTVLTTVNLDAATTLINLTVQNNSALVNLIGNNIETVYNSFIISANPQLSAISFNSLTSLKGNEWMSFDGNNLSVNINLPVFTSGNISSSCNLTLPNYVNGNIGLSGTIASFNAPNYSKGNILVYNTALTTLNLPNYTTGTLTQSNGRYISIFGNSTLTSISFANLLSLPNTSPQEDIYIADNSALNTISFPNLTQSAIMISANTHLSSINLSNLITGFAIVNNSPITSIDLTAFNDGFIQITYSNLQQLNLPNLTNGSLHIVSNSQLSTLSIPNLTSMTTNGLIRLTNNNLPSSVVNSVLNKMLTVTPTSGKSIYLKQLPAAPPTGQGITDKATLISNGNTVQTD